MPSVTARRRPASRPVSEIAGVTRPMMMNGTKNLMNCPKRSRQQFMARITQSGATDPIATPRPMARKSLGRTPILNFRMARIIPNKRPF